MRLYYTYRKIYICIKKEEIHKLIRKFFWYKKFCDCLQIDQKSYELSISAWSVGSLTNTGTPFIAENGYTRVKQTSTFKISTPYDG